MELLDVLYSAGFQHVIYIDFYRIFSYYLLILITLL